MSANSYSESASAYSCGPWCASAPCYGRPVRFALYFAFSLWALGHVGPARAAQMPEQFHGEWRGRGGPDPRRGEQAAFYYNTGPPPPRARAPAKIHLPPRGVVATKTPSPVA